MKIELTIQAYIVKDELRTNMDNIQGISRSPGLSRFLNWSSETAEFVSKKCSKKCSQWYPYNVIVNNIRPKLKNVF